MLEAPASPLAAITGQLAQLYAQKDAGVAAVLERLAPVEARVEALGRAVAAADPAVERLAAGVEEVRAAQAVATAGLGERVEPCASGSESWKRRKKARSRRSRSS